jgi:Ca2+-binding RTX toxin-like protein
MDVEGTAGNDFLQGSDGSDQLFGRNGNDTLSGGEGNDLLVAGFGDDTIYGGGGADTLSFEEDFGDDIAFGDAGDDVMLDRSGWNTLHGGDGNDRFLFSHSFVEDSATTGVGGAGRDDYVLGAPSVRLYPVIYTVADFQTSASGDRIDAEAPLAESALAGFYAGGNPFAEGFLRLLEESGDVLVQWDQDGAGTEHDWLTLVTLSDPFSDLPAASLTSDNFVGGLPDGSGTGQTQGGTSDPDTLIGGSGGDTLSGAEADDRLEGRHGDDSLLGDAGHDVLVGGFGNDTLWGGEGNDTLNLENDFGDDVVFGGAGDDVLRDRAGTNTLDGGEGADTFILGYPRDEVDDPADELVLGYSYAGGVGSTLIGGAGRDIFLVEPPRGIEPEYIAADFEVGSGGDLIDLEDALIVSALDGAYGGGNPFLSQDIVRLRQDGGDVRLEWDRDGTGTEHDWISLLRISGRATGSFTADNFVGGIAPDGSAAPGQTLNGTPDPDTLVGSAGDDTAHGAEHDDRIEGANGNDQLNGDAGNDTLLGGFGDDTVHGGDGDDELSDIGFGNDHLFGDAGNDFLVDRAGTNVIDGGDGDDEFRIWFTEAGGGATVTGGAGRDLWTWGILNPDTPLFDYVVTDFQAGAGGDLLQPAGMLIAAGSNGHYFGGNPFALKFLRLVQSGSDTLFQHDFNGTVDGAEWITVLRLQGIDRTTITSDNFVGELVVGTTGDDSLVGGLGNDTVQGLAGDDTLDGSFGRDILEGSAGDDFYFVDDVADIVIEENNTAPTALLLPGEDHGLAGVAGITDTVIASLNYSLANLDFVENLTLTGKALTAAGNALANTLTGNGRDNVLDGKAGADILNGGGGNDTLAWQAADRFDGGGGKDTLALKAGNLNLTRIADSKIRNVEQIDMDGSKDNTLTVSAADVLALSNSTNTLRVFGNDGDTVDLRGSFSDLGVSGSFHKYRSDAAILLVENDINVI